MHTKRFQVLGVVSACAACGLVAWKLWPVSKPPEGTAQAQTSQAASGHEPASKPDAAGSSDSGKPSESFVTPFTLKRLSEEHGRAPTAEEWPELTRILLHGEDGDMVESVKARFSVYAGTKELAVLGDAYDSPVNDDTRQRIIEIFAVLHSADFMEAARQILTNESLPLEDHLVNACAVSLARRGEQADIEAIFKRLNGAGEDPDPEGSLYSNADGLMGAISVVENPALEQFLCDAAAGNGAAITGRARAAAASALRNYHTVPVTEVLYSLSQNEENALVRKQAAASLKSIQTNE